jgi:hypothetical protein
VEKGLEHQIRQRAYELYEARGRCCAYAPLLEHIGLKEERISA